MSSLTSTFTAFDWGIVVVYMTAVLAVGFYANRYVGSMTDYVVAGRSLRSGLAIATMIGSELGLVTVMYAGEQGFRGGFAALHIGVLAGIVTLFVGLSGFLVVPLRRSGVLTIPEYYEKRFGRGVRILGGLILALAGILNMGLFLKAGALFVTCITGIQSAETLNWVMTILLALVLVYTILGGMVSVVVTDYLQFVVLAIGLLAACWLAFNQLGWQPIVDTVVEIGGNAAIDPTNAKGYGMSYVVWQMFVAGLVSCAIWPTAAMRACAAEDETVVRRLYIWSSIGFVIRWVLPVFLGICALAYFTQGELRGEFLAARTGEGQEARAAMPLFLGQILPAGLIGLVTAGMLAAFMSTHDSYLLCWSAVLTQDVVAPLMGDRLSTRARLLLTRVFVGLIGVFLLVWSLLYPLNQSLWGYMSVTGAIYFSGAFALLLFGLYWKRASAGGAYCALSCGLLSVLGLDDLREALGLDLWLAKYGAQVTGEQIGLTVAVACVVAMVLGSLIFPNRQRGFPVTTEEASA